MPNKLGVQFRFDSPDAAPGSGDFVTFADITPPTPEVNIELVPLNAGGPDVGYPSPALVTWSTPSLSEPAYLAVRGFINGGEIAGLYGSSVSVQLVPNTPSHIEVYGVGVVSSEAGFVDHTWVVQAAPPEVTLVAELINGGNNAKINVTGLTDNLGQPLTGQTYVYHIAKNASEGVYKSLGAGSVVVDAGAFEAYPYWSMTVDPDTDYHLVVANGTDVDGLGGTLIHLTAPYTGAV